MSLDAPVVGLLLAAAGAVLGFGADRLAVRWPEHDPAEPEHPPGRPIGWRTLVVVAVGAAAFGLLPGRLGEDPLALVVFGAWFVTLVIGLATDLDQRLLPDVLTLPVIPVAFVYALSGLNPFVGPGWVLAVGVALIVPLALYLPSLLYGAGAFGLGDVKLLVGVGLLLGFDRGLGGVLWGLLVAGAVLLVLLLAGRIGRRSYVPFGPFLILGALWAALVLGPTGG